MIDWAPLLESLQRNERKMFRCANRWAGPGADDAVATVRYRVARLWAAGKLNECSWAYLKRTLRNVVIDNHKSMRHRCEVECNSSILEAIRGECDSYDFIEAERQEARIEELLAMAPPEQAVVLRLQYVDDLTDREVAEVLGIEYGTVKSRSFRGIASIRRALGVTGARRRHRVT